jgi:hypothetical protein
MGVISPTPQTQNKTGSKEPLLKKRRKTFI